MLPLLALNLPSTHAKHAPPSGPVYPVLHWQSVSAVLASDAVDESLGQLVHTVAAAVSMYVPAKQLSHGSGPTASLKVPAAHSWHVPPSGPVYPALHWQSVSAVLASPEIVLSGQASHTVASVLV